MRMKQKELIEALYNKKLFDQIDLDQTVTKLVNDSRQVEAGACFIAIKGENFDGHQAIAEVVAQGAKLIIVEQLPANYQTIPANFVLVDSSFRAQAILANIFYREPSRKLKVVAVTGTNGKTTTSSMISDLLTSLDHKTGKIGTLHYKVADTYYPAVNTTPNALHLQALFAEMLERGCQDAVIEASSHALSLGRLWYTDVDCAIFTNLTREHLDFHKTMDNYAYAKSLLFSQLGQAFHQGRPRLAIINKDDPYWEVMAQATAADLVTYSLVDEEATAYASQIQNKETGLAFKLHFNDQVFELELPMRGHYNVSNYLAAFLCLACYYEIDVANILRATKDFKGVSGRMEVLALNKDFDVVVDFAHTSDALERVMQELVSHKQGRLLALMGHSGGNRDSGARPGIGDVLFNYADYIVFTADNPRFEDVTKICHEMIGQHDEKPYTIVEDRKAAVITMLEMAQSGDVLLFAGKGGEGYQIIGDQKIPYDDAEEIMAYYQEN